MFENPPTETDILAAIDIGTNNCRLLIASLAPDEIGALKPTIIDAFSRLVRLGEGLSTATTLSEPAMTRTLEALSVCISKMHRRGVTRYRAVATESCRRTSNAGIFLNRVEALTGLKLEVISAEEEARLALQGCAPLFEPEYTHGLHFDIGGGSTELVWTSLQPIKKILAQISIPCGVTSLTEQFGGDLVSPDTYAAMLAHLKQHLQPFVDAIATDFANANQTGRVQFLGCAGTISTIAALVLDLPFYQRSKVDGFWLNIADARRVFAHLLTLNYKGRSAIPALGPERADLIIAGCAIVEAIADLWDAETMRVADRGVREGILYDLVGVERIQ